MSDELPPGARTPGGRWRRAHLPVAIALLATLVNLPAVMEPLTRDDDLFLRLRLRDSATIPDNYGKIHIPPGSHRFGAVVHRLMDWVGPPPAATPRSLMESGVYPWFADENIQLAFWRPLTNLTHWLDYQLWPESAIGIHLHSILWFAIAAGAVACLFQRIPGLGAGLWSAAALAAVFWAADPRAYNATAWMAGRNISLCIAFGALAVIAHDAWRRGGARSAGLAAWALYALALLAGEPGVATAVFLAAYAVFLDPTSPRARLLSLAPVAVLTVAWRALYHAMGFGIHAVGLYFDPAQQPLRFAATIAEGAPILLVSQLGWPRSTLYEYLAPGLHGVYWAACVGALAVLLAFLWPLLRASATARFWCLAMTLAVVPLCSATPFGDRRLFFVAMGATALTAQWLVGVLGAASWRPRSRYWRLAAGALALGMLALNLGWPMLVTARRITQGPPPATHPFLAVGDDPALAGQELVLVTAPSSFLTAYLPFERALNGMPMPRRTRLLAPAFRTLEIARPAADTLVMRGVGGSLMAVEAQRRFDPAAEVYGLVWTNSALWDRTFPVPPGARRRLPGMEAEVLEADAAGLPVAVRFRFDGALEDSGRRWLAWSWSERRYVTFTPPRIGGSLRLPGPFAS